MKKRLICLLLALVLCLSVLPMSAGAEEIDPAAVWNSLKNSRLVCSSPICHPTAAITLVLPDGVTMDTLTDLGIRFYWWHGKGGQQAAHNAFAYTPTDEDAGYAVSVIFLRTQENGYDDYLPTAASLTVEPGRLVTWVANNDDEPVTERLPLGTVLTERTPEKPGYFFVGWYTDEALTKPWSFRTGKLTRDITLYARWFEQSTARTTPLDLTEARVSFTYRNGYPGSFDPAAGGISVLDNAEGWSWDASTKTLTLRNANFDIPATDGMAVRLPAGSTVVLEGENTVTGIGNSLVGSEGSLTVQGSGTLNLRQMATEAYPVQVYGLTAGGTLTIRDAMVNITLDKSIISVGIHGGVVQVENAELLIRSGETPNDDGKGFSPNQTCGIAFDRGATLTDSKVTIYAGDSDKRSIGIFTDRSGSPTLTVNGGDLDVRSGHPMSKTAVVRAIELTGALRTEAGSGAEITATNGGTEQAAITAAGGITGFDYAGGVNTEKSTATALYANKDNDFMLTLTAQKSATSGGSIGGSSGGSGGSKTQPVVKIPISSGESRDDLSGIITGGKLIITPDRRVDFEDGDVVIGARFTGDYDTTVLPKDLVSQLPGKDSLTVDGKNGTLTVNGNVLEQLKNAPLDIRFKSDAESRRDATPEQKKLLEGLGAAAAMDVSLQQNGSDLDLGDLNLGTGDLNFGRISADDLNIGNAKSDGLIFDNIDLGKLNFDNIDLGGLKLDIFDPTLNIGIAMEDGLKIKNDLPLLILSPRLTLEEKTQLIGGAAGLYLTPDGQAEQVPLFSDHLGELSLLTTHLSLYAIVPAECQHDAACPVRRFRDLDADAWYHDGVHACALLGLTQGVGNRTFDPDGTLTRAQFVTMLWRLAGEPGTNGDELREFSDVGSGGYYAAAVQWAAANGIAEGTSKTEFSPNAPITREQLAAMLFRYAMYDGLTAVVLSENLISFPDEQQLSDWAIPAMQWAVGSGIINGTPEGKLAPQSTATRAQAAAMIGRYLKK